MAQLTKELSIPIILVTHDLDEANMLADQLCVLHDGKTLQAGIPDAIMRRPKDATVARLIDIRNLFDAIVVEQNPKEGRTLLQWQGIRLEANYHPDFSMATKVNWCIPPTDVLLHRRIQPSRGTRENPVHGTVIEMISTSAITNVIIEISHDRELRLYMDLPPHVVKRNIIKVGDKIGVSLLANAIHIMPLQVTHPATMEN